MALISFSDSCERLRVLHDWHGARGRGGFLPDEDQTLEESRWPAGWWILPFAVCGLIP